MNQPYAFILDAYTQPEQSEAFAELFAGYIQSSRAESGCIEYHMLRDPTEPSRFTFYEVWQDQAAFDKHVALPHMRQFHEQRMNYLSRELQVRMINPITPSTWQPMPPVGSA